MEDTLRGRAPYNIHQRKSCLNPCFNGRYSQSDFEQCRHKVLSTVLILVLMEDTLRDARN